MTYGRSVSLPCLLVLALAGCAPRHRAAPTLDASAATVRDPAAHEVRFVEVARGVSLEVLDYGGTGEALVFLAGLGNTGHVFDDFAPAFTGQHHVYAITRRGFGDSSQPARGYDVATRVADDLAVLDALGIDRAVVVGHSIAGNELTGLAGQHPERVAGLVYLDAAYDQISVGELIASLPELGGEGPPPEAFDSPAALDAAFIDLAGVRMPMGEILAQAVFTTADEPGRWKERPDAASKVIAGVERPDYARVACPALALFAIQAGPADFLASAWATLDEPTRARWESEWYPLTQTWAEGQRASVRASLATVQVVELRSAHHYLFIRERDPVLEAMQAFLATM